MKHSYSTIDQYIASYPRDLQQKLIALKNIILSITPKETTETISYGMPTFRWNGNIIHFAMAKHHIGLYPGPAAIEHFKENLANYKTTKGAIQIPLEEEIPEELVKNIVLFNIDQLKDKLGPKWDTYRSDWKECDEFMNILILQTNLTKEFKWGTDIYTFQGKNVIGWAGFKNFFSLWFYNGVFLEDTYNVLVNASEGKTKALRQWRFTNISEMDADKILVYINESIQTIKDGKSIVIEKSKIMIQPEGLLLDALTSNTLLKIAFDKLTPGKQKDYIEYIKEAKQEKTKIARIDKITPLILAGTGLNDKYKK